MPMQNTYTWKDLAILLYYKELDKETELNCELLKKSNPEIQREFSEISSMLDLLNGELYTPSVKCFNKIKNYSSLLHDLKQD